MARRKRYLFLGGPWHGRRKLVHPGCTSVKLPMVGGYAVYFLYQRREWQGHKTRPYEAMVSEDLPEREATWLARAMLSETISVK